MNEVAAIVEGKTEEDFINGQLSIHLAGRDIHLWARLPGRVARHGGVGKWAAVRGEILGTLKERPGRVCTTMFDFYGMPSDWPGRTAACSMALEKKGPFVEDALLDDVCKIAGKDFRRELFIPYVQMHEFEALLFADVAKMSETLRRIGGPDDLGESLETIVRAAGSPEAINDNWETCPSRRILGLVPRYRKPFHGLVVAEQIGLNAMRRACPHFGQWVARLENLPVGKKE